jgi:hypothetical protein
MNFLKRIFDFYINSSIHVAFAVCGLVWITFLEFNLKVNINLLFFVFFATITGYNFVKYFGLAKFHHRSLATWLKYIQIFSFFCFLGLTYFTFKLHIKTLYFLAGLGLVTFLYAIPFLPKKIFLKKGNLRAISGLKIYVIAFVWAVTTVIIPLVENFHQITFDVLVSSLQRFIYVLVVMLPFEIRDMRYDSLKLATIPQRIGIRSTKIIGSILAILLLVLELFKDELNLSQLLVLTLIVLLMIVLLFQSSINQRPYYSSFWVEGIPIVWLGLSLI